MFKWFKRAAKKFPFFWESLENTNIHIEYFAGAAFTFPLVQKCCWMHPQGNLRLGASQCGFLWPTRLDFQIHFEEDFCCRKEAGGSGCSEANKNILYKSRASHYERTKIENLSALVRVRSRDTRNDGENEHERTRCLARHTLRLPCDFLRRKSEIVGGNWAKKATGSDCTSLALVSILELALQICFGIWISRKAFSLFSSLNESASGALRCSHSGRKGVQFT